MGRGTQHSTVSGPLPLEVGADDGVHSLVLDEEGVVTDDR